MDIIPMLYIHYLPFPLNSFVRLITSIWDKVKLLYHETEIHNFSKDTILIYIFELSMYLVQPVFSKLYRTPRKLF